MAPLVSTILRWWYTPRIRSNAVTAVLAAVMLGAGVAVGAWTRACAGKACPSIAKLGQGYDPDQASKVFAADGRLITDLGLERRTVVSLDQISPAAIAAFVVTEDKRFFRHRGVDWLRVLGALKANILSGGISQGFSTITMQLARNLFPEDISGQDRTIKRKLREMHVAFELEGSFAKDRILELYLNQINMGNGAYGIEAAAQRYLGKTARELNVAEAATLAAIPKAPTKFNPRRNPHYSVQRRNLILQVMADEGLLTQAEAERLLRQLEEIERGAYGKYPRPSYADYLERRSDEAPSPVNSPYLQGAVVIIEARTGKVLAMVGGRDFNESKYNRAVQATRQPGSVFKPFVYTAALRAGYPWSTILVDDPISVEQIPGEPPWEPQNYDNRFEGPMTLRRALFESRNIPAIKLGLEIGPQAVIGEARRFGLTTEIPPYPSIYIGSAAVYPLEIVSAFGAFATMGIRTTPYAIERVEDRNGRVLWAPKPRTEVVMDSALAWLILDGLRDVVRRGTAAGAVGSKFPLPAGGKTGTTNDYTDVWYVGFTPDLVAGVWIGMDKPERIMDNAQGGRLAAPAWTAMMTEIYQRRPAPAPWPRPEGLTFVEIDRGTGYRFTPFCPKDSLFVESFLPGTEPRDLCPVHCQICGTGSPLQGNPPHP
jgi:penicillin-binding protein 1A